MPAYIIKQMDLVIGFFICCVCVSHATCVRAPPEAQEERWRRGKNEKQNGHKQRHSGICDKPAEENTQREYSSIITRVTYMSLTYDKPKL